MTACATGCRITGEHRDICPGDCRGCLPRPAEHGTLCAWCYGRLTRDVADVPALISHLAQVSLGALSASGTAYDAETFGAGDAAERTVLHSATLDADELWSLLTGWAQVVIEEHPNQPMRGPAASPWHGDVVAWIAPHLEWVAGQEWAHEMRREMSEAIGRIRHRYPTVDDVEPVKQLDMPCPRCNLVSLIYTPPRYAGQAFRVECTDPDCARVFSEAEWDRFKGLALDVARRGKVAA